MEMYELRVSVVSEHMFNLEAESYEEAVGMAYDEGLLQELLYKDEPEESYVDFHSIWVTKVEDDD